MTPFDPTRNAQAVYDFWLGLIPQFMGQFVGGVPGAAAQAKADGVPPWMSGLAFPADQIARAAQMTQQSLASIAQTFAPMLGGGAAPNLFSQWAAAMPAMAGAMPGTVGSMPSMGELNTAFDRTYGALNDAFGLGPMRQLHFAWQDLLKAGLAQQEARAGYALVVQSAFTEGYQRLLKQLADKGAAGERIDSILALLKLWAISTEAAVHATLQSERGLAATAALTRSALGYHKAAQKVAAILADLLDIATRRDLDDAFREIQMLKRELRTMRRERSAT